MLELAKINAKSHLLEEINTWTLYIIELDFKQNSIWHILMFLILFISL